MEGRLGCQSHALRKEVPWGLENSWGKERKAGNNRAAHSTDQSAEAFCASKIAKSVGKVTMSKCK